MYLLNIVFICQCIVPWCCTCKYYVASCLATHYYYCIICNVGLLFSRLTVAQLFCRPILYLNLLCCIESLWWSPSFVLLEATSRPVERSFCDFELIHCWSTQKPSSTEFAGWPTLDQSEEHQGKLRVVVIPLNQLESTRCVVAADYPIMR